MRSLQQKGAKNFVHFTVDILAIFGLCYFGCCCYSCIRRDEWHTGLTLKRTED